MMDPSTKPTDSGPLHNSSSVLLALASLTPPSPILIPSQISTSFTSGDILILLDGPVMDADTYPESPSTIIREAISQSFSTGTVGTFGVKCRIFPQDSSPHISRSGDSRISISTHSISSVADPTLQSPEDPYVKMSGSLTSFPSETLFDPRSSPVTPPCHDTPICRPHLGALAKCAQAGDNVATRRKASEETQILQSISPPQTFPALPPSGFSSLDPSRFRNMFGSGPERLSNRNGPDPWVGECLQNHSPQADHILSVRSEVSCRHPQSALCSPMSPNFDDLMPHCRSDASFAAGSTALKLDHLSSDASSFLPENLWWLKGINLELLIDQEGFRSIQPSFRLAGYSSQSRSLNSRDSVAIDPGVAQFMPTRRQAFLFHYAPFDSPPVLRRLTVNGDETYDYISRQASLSVKSNGVYTVRGTETSSIAAHSVNSTTNHGSDAMKISWQFDYLVSDRRVDSTCKFSDGERTLTPLTFSCSPALLNSLQGKKVRLMHVVRKSVVPKLVAEKLQPPKLPTTVPPPSSNIMEAISCSFEGLHKRAHSYVHRRAGNEGHAGKLPTGLQWNPKSEIRNNRAIMLGPTRRRRASSAGERNYAASHDLPLRHIEDSEHSIPAYPEFPPSKHIIPNSHLYALFSADMENPAPVTFRNSLGFQPLTPPNYRPSGTTPN